MRIVKRRFLEYAKENVVKRKVETIRSLLKEGKSLSEIGRSIDSDASLVIFYLKKFLPEEYKEFQFKLLEEEHEKIDYFKRAIPPLVKEGLGSVKIGRQLGMSQNFINSFIKKYLPDLYEEVYTKAAEKYSQQDRNLS
jgi:hypothetical protein